MTRDQSGRLHETNNLTSEVLQESCFSLYNYVEYFHATEDRKPWLSKQVLTAHSNARWGLMS